MNVVEYVSPTACPNWELRLQLGQVPFNTDLLPMQTESADKMSAIFKRLRMPDLPGQPRIGDLEGGEWIDYVARAVWGGREVREAFICIAKKQSKSAHGGLMFFSAFLADKIPTQRYTCIAPTIAIARLVFDIIVGAIDADPTLASVLIVRRHVREVEHRNTGSILRVLPFSPEALTGLRGNVLLDEVWLLGTKMAGEKLRAQLKGALAATPSAKLIYITTTSDTIPVGMFAQLLKYARAVRDGDVVDPTFLVAIWEPWEGCDPWNNEDVWPMLLPSFPHIVQPEFYRSVIREANNSGPSAIVRDKAQFFNVTAEENIQGETWVISEYLPSVSTRKVTLDEIITKCNSVAIGIDLGGADDLSAATVIGQDADTSIWYVWAKAWATKLAMTRNPKIAAKLQDFVNDGDLDVIENGGDVVPMVDLCIKVREAGVLHGIGIDPAGAADLVDALVEAEFDTESDEPEVMGVGQTAYRLNAAVETFERRVLEGRAEIDNSRLLRWCFGNTVIVQRGQARGIEKNLPTDKIDPISATLDATACFVLRRPTQWSAASMVG